MLLFLGSFFSVLVISDIKIGIIKFDKSVHFYSLVVPIVYRPLTCSPRWPSPR